MSNTMQRIIVGAVMFLVACVAAALLHWGVPAVRWLGVFVAIVMIAEFAICIAHTPRDVLMTRGNPIIVAVFMAWLFVMLCAIGAVGTRPWIVLLLLIIICAADIGAWMFGRAIGGSKMWESLSSGKTWSGQIAGIICGTAASLLYGYIGAHAFMPRLLWIGIGVSLLSQYGDLTASFVKRRIGVKDFGTILPGHGGVLDRFDGWIYALPLIWFIIMMQAGGM